MAKKIIRFISVATIILTVLSLINGLWWGLEYAANFRVQYLIIQIVLFIILLGIRENKKFLALLSIFIFINLIPLIALSIPYKDSKKEIHSTVKILFANLHSDNNQEYKIFTKYVKKIDPDIIALVEINREWTEQLNLSFSNYYSFKHPGDSMTGTVLYSKFPFSKVDVKYFEYYSLLKVPDIFASIGIKGKRINLVTVHAIAPKSKGHLLSRNKHLLLVSKLIRDEQENNFILLGDFNMSLWSHTFGEIIKTSGLRDSRQGFGLQPTWPAYNPLLLIPIDHCLVGEDFVVIDRYAGEYIGSDHYPVIVEIGW